MKVTTTLVVLLLAVVAIGVIAKPSTTSSKRRRPASKAPKETKSDFQWPEFMNTIKKRIPRVNSDKILPHIYPRFETQSESGGKLSNGDALNRIRSAGIGISSSGGCHNRQQRTCTSLDQVNSGTIDGIITLKRASGCPITITGGTEIGHASGTHSHYTGYKLDISLNSCIDSYVKRSFGYAGVRSDGATMYKSSAGNVYAKEGNHWDILYY